MTRSAVPVEVTKDTPTSADPTFQKSQKATGDEKSEENTDSKETEDPVPDPNMTKGPSMDGPRIISPGTESPGERTARKAVLQVSHRDPARLPARTPTVCSSDSWPAASAGWTAWHE